MNNKLIVFSKAVFAGFLVGIAGSVYLATYDANKYLGAFLFSFALLFVCAYGLNLYTGKIGYIIDHKPAFIKDLALMILGNFLGISIIIGLVRMAGLDTIYLQAQHISEYKLAKEWWEVLGGSILCGMLMYLAVEGYKRINNDFLKPLVVILAVIVFLLAGFEHSIANYFYFVMAFKWNILIIPYLVLMLIGNGLGAVMINGLEKLAKLK